MGYWTDKHTADELELLLQKCRLDWQNANSDTYHDIIYRNSLGMKIKMLKKEIEDRIVDEILLDNNTKGNYGL